MRTVPDYMLFTLVQPSASIQNGERQMEVGDGCSDSEMTNDIDLMDTDNENDVDYESENGFDHSFINYVEMSEENELSFFRRLNNDL